MIVYPVTGFGDFQVAGKDFAFAMSITAPNRTEPSRVAVVHLASAGLDYFAAKRNIDAKLFGLLQTPDFNSPINVTTKDDTGRILPVVIYGNSKKISAEKISDALP